MKIKRIAASLGAAVLALSLVPVQPTQAAAKTSVYLVTQAKGNDGYTAKYTYNKNGLIGKAVRTSSYSSTEKNTVMETVSEDDEEAVGTTYTNTYEDVNDIYGTVKEKTKENVKEVSKYTYNSKGLVKKVVTTYVDKITHKTVFSTNSSSYDSENSGGYTETVKSVTTSKYSYDKKGRIKKKVTVYKYPTYSTYSKLSGHYATDYPEGEDSEMRNGISYKSDNLVRTVTETPTYKNGKIKKIVKATSDVGTDYEYTDGVLDSISTMSTEYTDVNYKYTYKNGKVAKVQTSDKNDYTTTTVVSGESDAVLGYSVVEKSDNDEYKYVTTYSYDRGGVLKSSRIKGTVSNKIFSGMTSSTSSIDGDTNALLCENTYVGLKYLKIKSVQNVSYQNTFKGDSNRLLQKTVIAGYTNTNGSKYNGAEITVTKYKLKSKKLSSKWAKLAEAQQQMLQTGMGL